MRKFSAREVEAEKIGRIVEAGLRAPTACNLQPYRIWVVKSGEAREKVLGAVPFRFVREAPALLVVGASEREGWVRKFDGKNFADIDADSEKVVLPQTFRHRSRKSRGTCLIWRIYKGNYGSAKDFWKETEQVKYVSRALYIDNAAGVPFYLHLYIGGDGKLAKAERQDYPWSKPEACTEDFQDSPSYL